MSANAEATLIVGLGRRDYSYRRVSYGLPVRGVEFRKVAYIPWSLPGRDDGRRKNFYRFRPFSGVDLFHLWNGICFSRTPWITSFEAHLPRYYRRGPTDSRYEAALEALHHDRCRRLLGMSEFARQFFFVQNEGRLDDSIVRKCEVHYGGVEIDQGLVDRHRRFLEREDAGFMACLVGHEFFRKGGVPLLRAFSRLKSTAPGLHLSVVSSIKGGDYVTAAAREDVTAVRTLLANEPGITWHESLPHDKVLQLMADSHVALLPTLDDSLGWSVLEAMSIGLPVIATGICAIPELLPKDTEELQITLPRGPTLRWNGMSMPLGTPERSMALTSAYDEIEEGIVQSLTRLMSERHRIAELGERALAKVRQQHDPETQGIKLGEIYRQALTSS